MSRDPAILTSFVKIGNSKLIDMTSQFKNGNRPLHLLEAQDNNYFLEQDIPVTHQSFPGKESDMPNPKPTYDELPEAGGTNTTYKSAGKLKGKRALITGGDSGIGAATALLFAREGASDITIVYLPAEEDDAMGTKKDVDGAGGKCHLFSADLTKKENCERAVQFAVDKMQGIDILFNNAACEYTFNTKSFTADISLQIRWLWRIFKTCLMTSGCIRLTSIFMLCT